MKVVKRRAAVAVVTVIEQQKLESTGVFLLWLDICFVYQH